MKRWIYTYEYVDGDPARLERLLLTHSEQVLRSATDTASLEPTGGDGSFVMELPTEIVGVHVAKRVRVSIGVAAHDGRRMALPVTWAAEPARMLFPRFDGTLEWEPLDAALGQLTLSGTYEAPLGIVGGVVDAVLLRDLAHGTAARLVEGVSTELTRLASAAPVVEHVTGPTRGRLHVRDVMTPNPILLDESLPLRTAALILFHAGISGAPVVRADGALVGVLSEADLLAKEADERFAWGRTAVHEDLRRRARTVAGACTTPARTTSPDAPLSAAARIMLDRKVSRLVVVAEGRIAGILTRHDVLAALVRDDRQLLAEVRTQLTARGCSDVTATVAWGTVTLTGVVPRRSTAAMITRVMEGIDGVMAVDGDKLAWIDDDVLPAVPAPM
jgi:CBS domain-containing protein